MKTTILVGDSLTRLRELPENAVDVVITDPVWPNVPKGLLPGSEDPHGLLRSALELIPKSIKRVVIILRSDSDPRFLTSVPSRWPFFHASWMMYALPGMYGRKLGGSEIAYCFGEPVPSGPGRRVIPGHCNIKAQPFKSSDHPCPRALEHMAWLVKWWSDPGETILDPFAGIGTTGLAAQRMDRNSILIEVSTEYAEIAAKRIQSDNPMFAKVEIR